MEGLGNFGKPTGELGMVEQANEDDAVVKWDDDGRTRRPPAVAEEGVARNRHSGRASQDTTPVEVKDLLADGRVAPRWLLYGRRLALEQFHLSFGILADNMVGSAATFDTEPFLEFRIPTDFQMFHCECNATPL